MSSRTPLSWDRLPPEEMLARSQQFYSSLSKRRTVREFSSEPIPSDVIESCLAVANTAPNGANLQPWHFVVVSDPKVKREIREGAEAEEREFYENRAPEEWLKILEPLGTDPNKPFLEVAPILIAIFQRARITWTDGSIVQTHYAKESTGLACGFLIAALHQAGLATLTHTPSPMGFLNRILNRPSEDKAFLLLVVGYPAENCQVPDIDRRPLSERLDWIGERI